MDTHFLAPRVEPGCVNSPTPALAGEQPEAMTRTQHSLQTHTWTRGPKNPPPRFGTKGKHLKG